MAIDLEQIFTYHPPINDQVERYQQLRDAAKKVAEIFISDARFEEKTKALDEYLAVVAMNVPECHQRGNVFNIMEKACSLAVENYQQQIVDLVLTASMFANAGIAINEVE